MQGRFCCVQLFCNPVDCGLSGFSVRERGSPGKNTEVYWQILVAIPYESTVYPASLAANSPDDLVLPEPLQPKQLHHHHTWPSQGQTQVLLGSLKSLLSFAHWVNKNKVLFWFCLWVYMYMCIFSHSFYCCYKPLPLHWPFAVLWSFPFYFPFSSSFFSFSFLFFCNFNF